jgi:hypothetical protein
MLANRILAGPLRMFTSSSVVSSLRRTQASDCPQDTPQLPTIGRNTGRLHFDLFQAFLRPHFYLSLWSLFSYTLYGLYTQVLRWRCRAGCSLCLLFTVY